MKKVFSFGLVLALGLMLISACAPETKAPAEKVISPLPQTLSIENLTDCTVAVSLSEGGAYVDESGKMQMKVTVFAYDLYDMVDIAAMKPGDTLVRLGKEVKITDLQRLDSGLIHINGGEEKGGFSLATDDSTVYFESGMNDVRAHYALGTVTLPVSEAFVFTDASAPDKAPTEYLAGDFLAAGIGNHFTPHNTTITIADGVITKMYRRYTP